MPEKLKLIVVNDNEPGEGLLNEWGWSCWLDLGEFAVLFDADTSPKVLKRNFKKLGLDPSKLSFAVLSHWHYDHYGGFKFLGWVRPGLKVYVPPGASEKLARWGLEPVEVHYDFEVEKGVWIVGPLDYAGISEIALAVSVEGKGLVLVVGCSHPGVDIIAERAVKVAGEKLYMVVGGFHAPPTEALDRLASMASIVCPAHCSGEEAKEYVKSKYPEKFCGVRTGSKIVVG